MFLRLCQLFRRGFLEKQGDDWFLCGQMQAILPKIDMDNVVCYALTVQKETLRATG